MAGIVVFKTMDEAVKAGFRELDRMPYGYLVERSSQRADGNLEKALAHVVLDKFKFELSRRPSFNLSLA
jgi:hypothetical protein